MSVNESVEPDRTSERSWEDAVQQAVADGCTSARNNKGVDPVKLTADVEGKIITRNRATIHVAFIVDNRD